MRKSRFSESQIVSILKEAENNRLKKMYADMALEHQAMQDGFYPTTTDGFVKRRF